MYGFATCSCNTCNHIWCVPVCNVRLSEDEQYYEATGGSNMFYCPQCDHTAGVEMIWPSDKAAPFFLGM